MSRGEADSSGFPQALLSTYMFEGKAGAALLQRRSRRCSGGASPLAVPGPGTSYIYKEGGKREDVLCN